MQVKRKVGKDEITVSGTPSQVDAYIEKWLKSIKPSELTVEMGATCDVIRELAKHIGWDDAKSAPILMLARRIK